jgi:hypothetical protein
VGGISLPVPEVNKMSPSWWALIDKMICEFQVFLAPNVPQFRIEEGIDCDHPTSRATSPTLKMCGVYLFFDDSESLRYIGVGDCLKQRIPSSRREILRDHGVVPRWIDVIPFERRFGFLAYALEKYLIFSVSDIEGNALVNRIGNPEYIDLAPFLEDSEEVPEKVALPRYRKEP